MKQSKKIEDILFNEIPNLQLNLDKIFKLNDIDKKIIIDLFYELKKSVDNFFKSQVSPTANFYDSSFILMMYNTLYDQGYLSTARERNIDILIENPGLSQTFDYSRMGYGGC